MQKKYEYIFKQNLKQSSSFQVEKIEGSEHSLRITGQVESGEIVVEDCDTVSFHQR